MAEKYTALDKGKGKEKDEEEEESLIQKRPSTKRKLLRFFMLRPSSSELKNRNILKGGDVAPRLAATQTELEKKKNRDALEHGLTQRATFSDLMRRNIVSSKGPATAGDVSPRFLGSDTSPRHRTKAKSRSLTGAERETAKSLLSSFFNRAPSEKNLNQLVHESQGKKSKKSKRGFRPISQMFATNSKVEKTTSAPPTTSTVRGALPLTARGTLPAAPPPVVLTDEEIQVKMRERIKSAKFAQFGIVPELLQEIYPTQPRGLPLIITCSMGHLEKYITKEGIFRIPPTLTKLMDIKNDFEEGWTDLSGVTDASVLAGLVSMFVREVPEPLFTFDLYDAFMSANDVANPEDRIGALRGVLDRLPKPNYRVIRQLVLFFYRVGAQSAVNKMTAKNLSIIFGSSLLKARIEPPDLPFKILKQAALVEFLINNCKSVFDATDEELSNPISLDDIEVKTKPAPVEEAPQESTENPTEAPTTEPSSTS